MIFSWVEERDLPCLKTDPMGGKAREALQVINWTPLVCIGENSEVWLPAGWYLNHFRVQGGQVTHDSALENSPFRHTRRTWMDSWSLLRYPLPMAAVGGTIQAPGYCHSVRFPITRSFISTIDLNSDLVALPMIFPTMYTLEYWLHSSEGSRVLLLTLVSIVCICS